MTLGEVKAQFTGLFNRRDLTGNTSLVSTFVTQSIMRIQRELRVPFMEKTVVYTIPSGWNGKLAIPSDLLELIDINVDGDGDGILELPLRRADTKEVQRLNQLSGDHPRLFTRKGGNWILGPLPRVGDQIEIQYYAEFAALPDDNSTNTATKVAWDAIVYGALALAGDYYSDDRTQSFEARYTQITQALQSQADSDELTADAVVRPALLYDGSDFPGAS